MKVVYTKWDGRLHWHFDLVVLGEDEHGLWLGGPSGTVLQRGEEPSRVEDDGFVCLVPTEGHWISFRNVDDDCELYVDVTDQPRRYDDRIEAIDLDLDVVRWRDGRIELVDEDELEEHSIAMGYPDDVVADVRATGAWLLAALAEGRPPFDAATQDQWLAALTKVGPVAG